MFIDFHKMRNYNQYPEYQTPSICLEAVKQDGFMLLYVERQTTDVCMAAVKKNPFSLVFVKDQTLEICLESVKSDGAVLEYVKQQTTEICLASLMTSWESCVYDMINIPIEGDFLNEIKKLKLLNGPML